MSDQTERAMTPIEALREVLGHFTPQINGADETCWIVGMRTQVRDDRMALFRAALAQPAAEPLSDAEIDAILYAQPGNFGKGWCYNFARAVIAAHEAKR